MPLQGRPHQVDKILCVAQQGIISEGLVSFILFACVQALLNIISNPVNSTVPIAVETLKKLRTYDPNKVFGVTTLDVVSLAPRTHRLAFMS